MFGTLKRKLVITAGRKLLNSNENVRLNTGKRILSLVAGAYIFQKGCVHITKSPILAVQEIALGALLVLNGASGMDKMQQVKPKRVSQVRKNQIQGNDPDAIPQFV